MLLLKRKSFEVESDSPVVTAADAEAIERTETLIAAAEAEAEEIRARARRDYEAEKARGYADGVAEGKEEILMQKLELLDESVKFMSGIEQKVSDIVIKALGKCVAEIGDEELVRQIVRKSMQAVVRTQTEVTIRVAPEMVDAVKARLAEITADYPTVKMANVQADPRYTGAACAVETEAGIVEASIEGQLAAIEKSIRKSFENS